MATDVNSNKILTLVRFELVINFPHVIKIYSSDYILKISNTYQSNIFIKKINQTLTQQVPSFDLHTNTKILTNHTHITTITNTYVNFYKTVKKN